MRRRRKTQGLWPFCTSEQLSSATWELCTERWDSLWHRALLVVLCGDNTALSSKGIDILWCFNRNVKGNQKSSSRDFPGSPVIKNKPASAVDTGLILRLGRSHRPQGNKARAPQQLSPHTWEPVLHNEKPLQQEACAPQLEINPTYCNYRKSAHSNEDPTQPKVKQINNLLKDS